MKESRRTVKKHIATCRAQKERSNIQKRDLLFKNCSNHHFRIFKPHSVCSKLLDNNNQPVTDPIEIAELFKSYFSLLASPPNIQTSAPVSAAAQPLMTLEANAFTHNDHILDTHVVTEEIEFALKALKLGRSKGTDGLKAEHLIYGGTSLILWLQKIFNSIVTLEEIPNCLKEGIIVPVYKGRGKDPLSPSSYRGVTLSSVISKTFEIVLLKRMSPILEETGF